MCKLSTDVSAQKKTDFHRNAERHSPLNGQEFLMPQPENNFPPNTSGLVIPDMGGSKGERCFYCLFGFVLLENDHSPSFKHTKQELYH